MDDLIAEFLTETNEGLDELDVDLVNLEQDPNNKDLLGKIFRLVHTIKGTCGFLGLPRLEKVAHHGENVLGRFRDGDLEVIPEYVTLIFESLDRIKEIVQGIEETGGEPSGDDTALIARLDAVYEGKTLPQDTETSQETASAPETDTSEDDEFNGEAEVFGAEENTPKKADADMSPPPSALSEGTTGIVSEAELEAAFQQAEVLPVEELKKELKAKRPEPAEAKKPVEHDTSAAKSSAPVSAQTLRVSVDVLENLMTMVSELVLTRNQLLQILRVQTDSDFATPLQRLNQIVSELQEGVMQTRMQPIGNAWAKLPRIIRDLSLELGKKINLEMLGQDTELDRQVLELIKDPLTHMVRNSADHGIEMPEDRTMTGKPETGKIVLNAFHEGGHIIIQISDDGRGLPVDKIKQKVLSNGLATEDELAEMTDQQIQKFIFRPGFSTAAAVTAVSGRGVGMDVVRTNIEKIGGTIDLTSTEGKGSVFTIKIPLTLAIVSALIVESAGQRFAIPQLTVRELVMISAQGDNQIENINGAPVFRLRDSLLPLVYLNDVLKMHPATPPSEDAIETVSQKETTGATPANDLTTPKKKGNKNRVSNLQQYIVVSQIGQYQFGIIVDRVFDTEEIVVKPVSKILRDIDIFSGNTILGDGSVVMILDSAGIARTSGEMDNAQAATESESQQGYSGDKAIPFLLFSAGDGSPKAVPLALVSRLEQISGEDIEIAAGEMVIQYRNQLMTLVPFHPGQTIDRTKKDISVLVLLDQGKVLGIVVDEILDITEAELNIQHNAKKPHLMGSSVIQGKTTDVVDVGYYLKQANSNWFADHPTDVPFDENDASTGKADGASARANRSRVLLVDDSPFFRNMLTPLLSIAGYDVTSLDTAEKALEACENGMHFDIIISDIEMPEMSGFEFAEKVRSNPHWKATPMVALSSHATEQDMARGRAVGFDQYVAKFDRDKLLDTISQTLVHARTAHAAKG